MVELLASRRSVCGHTTAIATIARSPAVARTTIAAIATINRMEIIITPDLGIVRFTGHIRGRGASRVEPETGIRVGRGDLQDEEEAVVRGRVVQRRRAHVHELAPAILVRTARIEAVFARARQGRTRALVELLVRRPVWHGDGVGFFAPRYGFCCGRCFRRRGGFCRGGCGGFFRRRRGGRGGFFRRGGRGRGFSGRGGRCRRLDRNRRPDPIVSPRRRDRGVLDVELVGAAGGRVEDQAEIHVGAFQVLADERAGERRALVCRCGTLFHKVTPVRP